MGDNAGNSGVNTSSSGRRGQLELNHISGPSSDAALGTVVREMEEGKICGTGYVQTNEPQQDPEVSVYRKLAAEAIATFVLVFLGCGSIITDNKTGGAVTRVGISLAFGLAIMAMVRAVGHISGAHMNPAITIAFASVRDFPLNLVPSYILAQVGGSIAAGFVLRLMLDIHLNENLGHLGTNTPTYGNLEGLAMEFISTLILMFVVSSVAVDSKSVGELAGLILGLTITLLALVTGGSMNPARSIGPAVAANWYKSLWVFVAGPIVGAVTGAWLYALLHGPQHLASESEVRVRPHSQRRRKHQLCRKREGSSVGDEGAVNATIPL